MLSLEPHFVEFIQVECDVAAHDVALCQQLYALLEGHERALNLRVDPVGGDAAGAAGVDDGLERDLRGVLDVVEALVLLAAVVQRDHAVEVGVAT